MKARTLLIAGIAILLATAESKPGVGQQQQTAATANESVYILAELTQSLNGKKLKPGDQIKAEVSQDVLWHGRIIIPVESKLLGYVTEVQTRGSDAPSRLGIVFDKVVLKHHEELEVQGVVHALSPAVLRHLRVDDPDPMMPPVMMQSGARIPSTSSPRSSSPGPAPQLGIPPSASGTAPATPLSGGILTGNIAAGPVAEWRDLNSGRNSGHLSVGMPQGVFGLKGLSLTQGSSQSTPGPVITSVAQDVKLDYGTQVLVKVAGIPPR